MTSVDEKRLKGNFGTAFVAQLLSTRCLVRPVSEGTDIGVDLYCESIAKDGQHFWVQVKARRNFRISKETNTPSFRFERKHLEYWSRQPVPVFAFLVPVPKWPPKTPHEIFVVDVTLNMVENPKLIETGSGGISLASRSDFSLRTGKPNSLARFIDQHVPFVAAAQKISDGIVAPANEPRRSDNLRVYPHGYTVEYIDKILSSLRITAALAANDLAKKVENCDRGSKAAYWKKWGRLIGVLEQFNEPNRRYIEYVALGAYALAKGNLDHAKDYKSKARDKILRNKTLGKEARGSMLKFIESLIPEKKLKTQESQN